MDEKTEHDKSMTKATDQLRNLTPIDNWQSIANGIWRCQLGDISKEQCYSNLAAEPPRLDRINALSPAGFPFVVDGPSYQNNDGKITVRIPAEADEQLYGFGLQFDDLQALEDQLDLCLSKRCCVVSRKYRQALRHEA